MEDTIQIWKDKYPEKFIDEDAIFQNIRRGNRIFISTGCGEPEYLVNALIKYVESNPKAVADAEIFHIWTLGVAPYTDEKFKDNFRHNSFFVSNNTRESVNKGLADYTPIFLSQVPGLIAKGLIQFDVALIHTSLPDKNGYLSLGISVDIAPAAITNASLVIAQINSNMPRVHGDSFINIKDIDFVLPHDEPLLEFSPKVPDEIAQQVGKYVSQIVNDGDTIQVGYGSLPNAVLYNMQDKKHLGIHTELITNSVIELIKKGIVDNSMKSRNWGRTVATFCMGSKETYEFLNDNPIIRFRTIDYTSNPLVISSINNMTAINSALQVDLTGQATAESIGSTFFSGIGGSANFMRGAVLATGGKSVLVLQSTARNGEASRIVPLLDAGAGVTYTRGDIHYIVTELGIAYIHGKNIRERAMDLIAIAHPKFRPWLIEEAKKINLIYKDQAFIPGKKGEYPEHLEAYRTTKSGINIFLRPVKINDETLIKDFFYSLSDKSLQRRFLSKMFSVPHKMRQKFVVIDYTMDMAILAIIKENDKEILIGIGQYYKNETNNTAEVAFAVRDDYHNKGVGTELLSYLSIHAKKEGLQGFTADVFYENRPMIRLFESMGFDISKRIELGVVELTMRFV
ncbi:MAG: GNAT family N-acetyltransferase [Spirochaetota bacterium]|nr:GNAT family N-acetyltransferase [Spirochaetota bacterium]